MSDDEPERLEKLSYAAEVFKCSPKTLENPYSPFRKALERAGAIRKFGRTVRVTRSGVKRAVADVAAKGAGGATA